MKLYSMDMKLSRLKIIDFIDLSFRIGMYHSIRGIVRVN